MNSLDFIKNLSIINVNSIYTLLDYLINLGSIESDEIYIWIDKEGRTDRSIATRDLLLGIGIITEKERKYYLNDRFLVLLEKYNLQKSFEIIFMSSISFEEYRLFIENSIVTDQNLYYWKIDEFSPFMTSLRDFFISIGLIRTQAKGLISSDQLAKHINNLVLKSAQDYNNSVTYEQLMLSLAHRNKLGEEAEKVALEFEIKRLKSVSLSPVLVSKLNVTLGYDIESYDDESSKKANRFIEVKYFNSGHFYISINEVNKAKELGIQYWIYLVTVDDYNPEVLMISNPYETIFNNNNWKLSTEVYKVNKLG